MSNLTVSYVSQTPPGTAPAGGTAAAAPGADSPLGFLAALMDQLLTGASDATAAEADGVIDAVDTTTTAATSNAAIDLPGLLTAALGTAPAATPSPSVEPEAGPSLVVAVTEQLERLQTQVEGGETIAPAQLASLGQTVDALSAAIETPAVGLVGSSVPATTSTPAPAAAVDASATVPDKKILQLLSDLGLIEPSDEAAAPVGKAESPVAVLHDKLVALSQTLAATAPALSQKLDALASKIEATPDAAVRLGLAAPDADTDTATIAHIIRTLLGHPGDDAATTSELPPAKPTSGTDDDLLKILAKLGIEVPPTAVTTATDASLNGIASVAPAAMAVPTVEASTIASVTPGTAAPSATAAPAPSPAASMPKPVDGQLASPDTASAAAKTVVAPANGEPVPASKPATPAPATTSVPAPLVRLSAQLTEISTALAAVAPELSAKIEAVATRLVSADVEPDLAGKLTSAAAQPSGTSLDNLVQVLIDPKSAPAAATKAAPQIAAPASIVLPAPQAPKPSKSAATEVKAAPPEPAPVTADSAPKPAAPVAPTVAAAASVQPSVEAPASDAKPEAKVADLAKADASAPQAAQPQQPSVANTQQARTLPAAYQPVANPINMGQVAFEMVRQVHAGSSRFSIRLDPPEMGRVDVKLHVDANGTVNARLTVDRAETLDLFQRDRQSLERALAQAGLDTGKTNLEFSLRQQSHNPFAGMMGGDGRQHHPSFGSPQRFASNDGDDVAALPAITLYRGTASAAGVNILA